MLSSRIASIGLALGAAWLPVTSAAQQDVPGSTDYPGIGRFEDSVILSYDVKDFDEYRFLTGPVKGKELQSFEDLEGKIYRISYKRGPGPSLAEVTRNFTQQLDAAGFDIAFACADRDCGMTDFRYAIETLPVPKMQIDGFNYRYLAAQRTTESGTVHATVLTSVNNQNIFVQLFVVEGQRMESRMVDADQMASSIAETGRVALYGIFFDTDKTDIKPESRPTLEQIAALLSQDATLKLIVVGHTDNQGDFDYNMDLSERRAAAVVQDLTGNYGIAAARLRPAGVGFLAPVASNGTADGRALNRRVELVQR